MWYAFQGLSKVSAFQSFLVTAPDSDGWLHVLGPSSVRAAPVTPCKLLSQAVAKMQGT